MSVINKTLTELNKRSSGTEYDKYVPPEKSTSPGYVKWIVLAFVTCAVIGGGYYAYSYMTKSSGNREIAVSDTGDAENQVAVQVNKQHEQKQEDLKMTVNTDTHDLSGENNHSVTEDSSARQTEVLESDNSPSVELVVADSPESTAVSGVIIEEPAPAENNSAKEHPAVSQKTAVSKAGAENSRLQTAEKKRNKEEQDYIYDAEHYIIEEDPVPVVRTHADSKKSLKVSKSKLSEGELAELYRKDALNAMGRGKGEQAIDAYRNLLAVKPNDIEAREKLASLYFGKGNNIEAVKVLDKGIALNPYHYDYRLFLARIYKSLGDNAKAIRTLVKAKPPVSGNVDYYATLASISRDSGDFKTAADAYRMLSTMKNGDGKWLLGLAICEEKQGNLQQALVAYKKSSSLYLSQSSRKFVDQRIKFLEATK